MIPTITSTTTLAQLEEVLAGFGERGARICGVGTTANRYVVAVETFVGPHATPVYAQGSGVVLHTAIANALATLAENAAEI